MTAVSSRPVARLSSPGDIVATIPTLCGFQPQESIVVLSLRGPRKRLGLTARLDLPPPEAFEDVARMFAERVAADGGDHAVVTVFSDVGRAPALIEAVCAACTRGGIEVTEALHVMAGRWTSYHCQARCCPAEGTPVPVVPSLVAAEHVLAGHSVLSSREELVRSLAPPQLLLAAAAEQRLDEAFEQWIAQARAQGVESVRRSTLELAHATLDVVTQGAAVDQTVAASLAVGLHDVAVRDELAAWSSKRSDALLSLLEQMARLVGPPDDAPTCTLLAWVVYARGDGSKANIALDRALASDPSYALAQLLRQALDGGVPPREIRRTMRATRRSVAAKRPTGR